mgnify:CR=1 FL=1
MHSLYDINILACNEFLSQSFQAIQTGLWPLQTTTEPTKLLIKKSWKKFVVYKVVEKIVKSFSVYG